MGESIYSRLLVSCRDRIEYEEWLLKALDASTAPKLPKRRRKEEEELPLDEDHTVVSRRPLSKPEGPFSDQCFNSQVPLYYPPSLVSADHLQQNLKTMLDHRAPHHDKLMKRSFLLMRASCFRPLWRHQATDVGPLISCDHTIWSASRSP